MSRSRNLVKNTAILTLGKMSTQFISFLLLPLYTALLIPDEFGVVELFTSYIALLLPLVCLQFDQGIFRFLIDVRDDKEKTNAVFSSVSIINILQCVAVIVIFIFVQSFINSEYKWYLIIGVVLNVFSGLLMQFARGIGKMTNYSVASFLSALSTVVLNILFIVVLKMGAHGMFFASMIGIGINCLYLFFALKVWCYFSIKNFDWTLIKEIGKYSLPLIPNQMSGWILSTSDRTILSCFLGVAANGIYSVAYKFSNLVGTFYGFFNLAWIETVSVHFNDVDCDRFISEMMEKVLGIFITVSVGIIAVMPFVFSIMIDEQYNDSYNQIPILLIAVIFQILVGLYSSVYIALKKSKVIAKTTIVGAIINVVVHLVFIKFIGIYAASVSTLVSYACVAVYRSFDVKKYKNINLNMRFILLNVGMIVWTTISYYLDIEMLNIFTLVLVSIFAFIINKDILRLMINELKTLLGKIGVREADGK